MNATSRLGLLACLLSTLAGAACSSSASSPLDASDAGAPASTACVYQMRTATYCDGDSSFTDWQTTCADLPCSDVSWDPHTVAAGDCYGDTEYQGSYTFSGTCSQWQAQGSPSELPPSSSATACDILASQQTGTSPCTTCMQSHCCGAGQPCAAGTECAEVYVCAGTCVDDGQCTDGGPCSCGEACAQTYPQGIPEFVGCAMSACADACGLSADGGA
jgi:hypothetical protein